MWGRVQALRKRRAGSLEAGEWPGGLPLDLSPPEASESKEARLDRFKQQTLSSYTVTFSPRLVIGAYFFFALIFLPLGAAVIAGSSKVRSTVPITYNAGACKVSPAGSRCVVPFNVTRDIPPPSFLFYVVTNLHQNYREYVKSRSFPMLQGRVPVSRAEVRDCWPVLYRPENSSRSLAYFDNPKNPFVRSEILNPCGLTANSRFNDTLQICTRFDRQKGRCSAPVSANRTGIAWASDRLHKYNPNAKYFTPSANLLLQDEAFMVWMRLSTFARAEKLYGRIEQPLRKGLYFMEITSRFPARRFDGDKQFFISNTKWFGARNHFLGVLYVVTGVLSLVVALIVLVAHVYNPRPPADFNPDLIRRELTKLSIEYAQSN